MTLIDISHTLDQTTPVYPGDFQTAFEAHARLESDGYNSVVLHSGMHTSTHVDMPMHLTRDARTAADFPPGLFCGKGVLLDARGQRLIGMRPEYRALVAEGDIALIMTGWDKNYHSTDYFTHHPVAGADLADFLLASGIKMLGMDMPSPDYAPHNFHRALLERGIFVLENLARLDALLGVPRFEVFAFPLKIRAEASPVRAVCAAEL